MGAIKKIYILHGWTYETDKWDLFISELKRHNIHGELLKIPGLTEVIDRPWTLRDYVQWLETILKGEKDVILCGHSNGGRIALAYTLAHYGSIEQLILIDSAGIYHNEVPIRIKRFIFKTIAKVGKKFTKNHILRNALYKLTHEQDYHQATGFSRETMVNMISIDLSGKIAQIKTPTLIIWGKDDVMTPVKDGIIMHSLIRNSQLAIINGARHSPQFSHTKEVVGYILKALSHD